jgi:hypothetical protein
MVVMDAIAALPATARSRAEPGSKGADDLWMLSGFEGQLAVARAFDEQTLVVSVSHLAELVRIARRGAFGQQATRRR